MNDAKDLFYSLQRDQKGFMILSDYLKKSIGISMPLNNKNLCLMASRLSKVMRVFNFVSYNQLYEHLRKGDHKIHNEFLIALTTNTTHFFREQRHFEILSRELPRLCQLDSKDHEIRLWCAASSSGQEPYTIAMVCQDYMDLRVGSDYRVLATDIDLNILGRAAAGYYTENEVLNIDESRLKKYFQLVRSNQGRLYRVKSNLANRLAFAQLNLTETYFPFKKKFHVVFARNVFIYFEKDLIDLIIDRIADSLHSGGLLFLGHSESGTMRSSKFEVTEHAVYRRL